ncbi:MAG: guanylate kinase, partial [Selenomonadaceae bacterium]|nr:guanylate kinase [Selenomonadaceae bacterium]
ATTRQPRNGEVDGKEYFFISVEQFKSWLAEDKFLEYAEVYGNFYGTPLHTIEERRNNGVDVLLEIDVQGALKVMSKCPDGVYIFLLPPSLDELCNRIKNRGTESPESLQRRINSATNEIATAKNYQYVVVNDSVNAAVEKIKSIITAEHCKVNRNEIRD